MKLRDILPCTYENQCSPEEKIRIDCSKCELYRPKLPIPAAKPVVLNFSEYAIYCKSSD